MCVDVYEGILCSQSKRNPGTAFPERLQINQIFLLTHLCMLFTNWIYIELIFKKPCTLEIYPFISMLDIEVIPLTIELESSKLRICVLNITEHPDDEC